MSTNNTPSVVSAPAVSSVVSALFGLALKGQIFKSADGGDISISIPGGRNFGGIFAANLEIAEVNGRQIAVSGSYDDAGLKKMESFEGTVKAAYLDWVKNPQSKMIQSVSFDGKTSTKIRFAKENSTNAKAPIAAYYLSL